MGYGNYSFKGLWNFSVHFFSKMEILITIVDDLSIYATSFLRDVPEFIKAMSTTGDRKIPAAQGVTPREGAASNLLQESPPGPKLLPPQGPTLCSLAHLSHPSACVRSADGM